MILLLSLALAHPLDPVSVHRDGEVVELRWSVDSERPLLSVGSCAPGAASVEETDGMWVERRIWDCAQPPERLQLDAGERVALVRWGALQRVLRPRESEVALSGPSSSFVGLGVQHLIEGADHVALIVGMTVLLGAGRTLLVAVTAFTVGHGLTLWLATLGWIPMSTWVAEACIAASLVAIGVELTEEEPWWHPAMPLVLGLVHGLGFAATLEQLTDAVSVSALFGFNLGVELGQLAVVAVVLAVLRVIPPTPRVPVLAGWVIGLYGAMLLVERGWS